MEQIRLTLERARFDADGTLYVIGWAIAEHGLRGIEVFFGAYSLGFARTKLFRPDVAAAFPDSPEAPLAGFEFAAKLPRVMIESQPITVFAYDSTGRAEWAREDAAVDNVYALPMRIVLEEACVNEDGELVVRGWVLSPTQVIQVNVYVDGEIAGEPMHHLPRDDVAQAYPDYPDATRAGFLLQRNGSNGPVIGRPVKVAIEAAGDIQGEATGVVSYNSPTAAENSVPVKPI